MQSGKQGYKISLIYFWLNSPELAINRVAQRVKNGGHNIPREVIIRRYAAGINNLFRIYMPLVDYWLLAERRMLEEKALRNEEVIQGTPDGRIKRVPARELLKNIKKEAIEERQN